jgi:hypothetical protein
MARIRSIHPGIWTDEDFVTMGLAARLLFIGVLNECDDQGVFMWKPTQLKMRLLPADNVDISALLAELTKAGFIRKYAANGSAFGAVRHFREFQRPKKPNAVHPITNEIRSFSGPKSETCSPPGGDGGGSDGEAVPGKFPQERRGGKEEKEGKYPPSRAGYVSHTYREIAEGPVQRRNAHLRGKNQRPKGTNPRANRHESLNANADLLAEELNNAEASDAHPSGAPVVPFPRRAIGG